MTSMTTVNLNKMFDLRQLLPLVTECPLDKTPLEAVGDNKETYSRKSMRILVASTMISIRDWVVRFPM